MLLRVGKLPDRQRHYLVTVQQKKSFCKNLPENYSAIISITIDDKIPVKKPTQKNDIMIYSLKKTTGKHVN